MGMLGSVAGAVRRGARDAFRGDPAQGAADAVLAQAASEGQSTAMTAPEPAVGRRAYGNAARKVVVFEGPEDYHDRLDDPSLGIDASPSTRPLSATHAVVTSITIEGNCCAVVLGLDR